MFIFRTNPYDYSALWMRIVLAVIFFPHGARKLSGGCLTKLSSILTPLPVTAAQNRVLLTATTAVNAGSLMTCHF